MASNGVLNLGVVSAFRSLQAPLTNHGTINWMGSALYVYGGVNNGAIYNQPGGLFDVQCDQEMHYGDAPFANHGTFRKRTTAGITVIATRFENANTVQVQTGTLHFGAGGTLAASYSAAAGAAINLTGGNFVQSGAPVFTGPGPRQITGGTLMLTTDVIPGLTLAGGNLYLAPTFQGGSITNLALAGMNLYGTNTIGGLLDWTGGTIYGALTVASNGVLNLGGVGANRSLQAPLTNHGTINWLDGVFYVYGGINNGAIYNQPGGLFDVQCDQAMHYGDAVFANGGILRKRASTGTTVIATRFENAGIVEAQTGTINLPTAYSNSPSANLAISLGGTAPGIGYGHIHFTSLLGMDGTFTVTTRNGFVPSPGDTFNVLSYPSATNEFTCLSGLDLGGGVLLLPSYGPTILSLLATAYTATNVQPQLFITRSPAGIRLTWPAGFPNWVLQSNTNLSSTNWSSVAAQCDGQAVVPVTTPQQYFRLRNLTVNPPVTPAHAFSFGATGTGPGQLRGPLGIAVDDSGNVYVVDLNNHRIQKFTGTGQYISQWGVAGTNPGQLNLPYDVAVDTNGSVYVADSGNARVQKFASNGTFLLQWGSVGGNAGQFSNPYGIAVDAAGNVNVSDSGNHSIQKFSNAGAFLDQWGGFGASGGQLNSPRGLAVDTDGNAYVADVGNRRMQKFAIDGTYLLQWGSPGTNAGQFGNTSTGGPNGAAVDRGALQKNPGTAFCRFFLTSCI